MANHRILTGIKPTGTPHLGNYAGALRPAIVASQREGVDSFFFLADYHALIQTTEPDQLHRSTLEIAATWLAAGLDCDKVTFYRQSDIPEILELTWLLTCMTNKGLLNRAHAYKAAMDKNRDAGEDTDSGISMGLYMYPVLMAADILLFKANAVPVGSDQIQHIEIARDIAGRFNHYYGQHLVLPAAVVDDNVETLPGLDGRKMSKSYGNVIPLFASEDELKQHVFAILTDASAPGEAKQSRHSPLFQLFQAFARADETATMRQAFAHGISWGEAKQQVFEQINQALRPLRERYQELIAAPARIEEQLQAGAAKARELATPFLAELRDAVGLRKLPSQFGTPSIKHVPSQFGTPSIKHAPPQFKQYREGEYFFFKLTNGKRVLLSSVAFSTYVEANQAIGCLKKQAGQDNRLQLTNLASLGDGVTSAEALAALRDLNDNGA